MRRTCLIATLTMIAAPAVFTEVAGDGAQIVQVKRQPPAAPAAFSLELKLHAQEADNWCWAASGQMVMEHFGQRVPQSVQANHRFKRSDCGQHPCPHACNQGGAVDWAFYHFATHDSDKPLSQHELIHQFHALKKPITFVWSWSGGSGAHVMVACGYFRLKSGVFMVEVLDPAPPLHKDKDSKQMVGGDHKFITYKQWVAAPGHKLTHVNYNITRK